jgi:hypothetical protein
LHAHLGLSTNLPHLYRYKEQTVYGQDVIGAIGRRPMAVAQQVVILMFLVGLMFKNDLVPLLLKPHTYPAMSHSHIQTEDQQVRTCKL